MDATQPEGRAIERGFSALVIDDDDFSRHTATRILERLGAGSVETLQDGDAAQRWFANGGPPPDVILCDLRMPGMDGVETLRRLAATDVPGLVILVSGADARVLRSARLAATDFGIRTLRSIEKPLTLAKLQTIFDEAVLLAPLAPAATGGAAPEVVTDDDVWKALAAQEFAPWFQPQIDLRTQEIAGMEALVRWTHPTRGVLPPGVFLAAVLAAGAMDTLTEVVLRAAAARCRACRDGGEALSVSVNLNVASLTRRDLPQRFAAIAAEQGLAAEHVTFEVTEDGWLREPIAREVLTRLRLQGFGLSIDDFGTGYATMHQLLEAPFDELKIDQSFVRAAPDDEEAAAAMAAAIGLAHKLRLRSVGEGIETPEQWRALRSSGCDIGQGYAIARPMPADALPDWLRAWRLRRGAAAAACVGVK